MIKRALPLFAAAAVAACSQEPAKQTSGPEQSPPPATEPAAPPAAPTPTPAEGEQGGTDQWKTVATAEDQDRIARLPAAWTAALAEADQDHGAEIDALSLLAVPDGALAGRLQPGPGKYRCRTIKIGAKDPGNLDYVAYPWFSCTVELTPGGDLILTKTGGSQRTRGLLYPDPANDRRLIYIGAQAWGTDEKSFPAYGQQAERDQVGVFERVGLERWRLVLPWPKQEAKLEILELKK
jgi:hypothetical protein